MDDRRLELIIGNLLRIGVMLAAGVVSIGGILYVLQHAQDRADFRHFTTSPASITTVPGIVRSATALQSEGLIQLGLLLLIATPVARVALAVAGFGLERDWLYTGISLIVLVVLIASLVHAT
jgi:uncharacterized membrane protein